MFTAAECRSIANQKLAQAEHDDRHRRRLINAAEAWLFLAYRLSGEGPGRLSAMADKMTNDLMDSAIYNMWTQVVVHGTTSVTKSVMTLLKGQ
jgi:hypothetical protein